jgi:transcriptional regulator with XRE-family HTH domain
VPHRASLGEALRALRKDKGLTEVELARKVGITQTSVSRYESDVRLPSAETLEKIADSLGASKRVKRQLLEQLHGALTQLDSLRSITKRGMRRRQEEIARLEAKATHMRNFQMALVPGLLQTPGYARRIFEEVGLGTSPTDVAQALAARLDRQAALHDPGKRFGFVLTEAVLLWPRGGSPEMLAQLERLRTVADLPNVDLAILPLDIEPPQTPLNSFTVFDEDLVLVATLTEQLAIADPADVALHVRTYERFREAAVSGAAAQRLLSSAASRFQQP